MAERIGGVISVAAMKKASQIAWCVALNALLFGCGGSEEPPASWTGSAGSSGAVAVSESPRFSEMLLPLGEHQSREELQAIARFIRRWEQDPYGEVPENDIEMSTNAAMLAWVAESPDVHVTICPILSELARSEGTGGDPGPALTPGYLFGMTAYLIEHPERDPEGKAVQVAGMESGLRWYEAAVAAGVVPRNSFADELLGRLRSEGGLLSWYDEREIRCGDGGGEGAAATGPVGGAAEAAPPPGGGAPAGGETATHTHPSRDEVGAMLRAAAPAVQTCLAPGQMVQVAMVFRGSDGKPTSVEVSGTPGVEDCVKAALEGRLALQPFAREEFRVSYPFAHRR